ncbi:hypothetical protein [Anabaena sp. CCY 9613]|uniref:hypothetical protein n=2 Tax=unclassified Anabaena TaxID=2619674 RepID=UPI0039C5F815
MPLGLIPSLAKSNKSEMDLQAGCRTWQIKKYPKVSCGAGILPANYSRDSQEGIIYFLVFPKNRISGSGLIINGKLLKRCSAFFLGAVYIW